ncbi:hypothetical protein [Helicobacter sp. T3_23-1056]
MDNLNACPTNLSHLSHLQNLPFLQDLPTLQKGAVFIADSHYRADYVANMANVANKTHDLDFATKPNIAKSNSKKINAPKINAKKSNTTQKNATQENIDSLFLAKLDSLIISPPPQVFFMGDIADLFIGHIPSSARQNRHLIQKINALSQKCEVFYFEGNHDFGIDSRLLPNVKIYPRIAQPALFDFGGKIYALAHGDIFIDKGYEIYIRAMNVAMILSGFRILDILSLGKIYDFIRHKVHKKRIKRLDFSQNGFYDFAKKRTQKYINNVAKSSQNLHANKKSRISEISGISGIIEGHFHIGQRAQITDFRQNLQNTKNTKESIDYISLPSFFCHQDFFILS